MQANRAFAPNCGCFYGVAILADDHQRGAKTSSVRLLVQVPGSASKMSRAAFARAMESMPSFRNLMSAYIHAFLEQVLVSVACNGAHGRRSVPFGVRLIHKYRRRSAAAASLVRLRLKGDTKRPALSIR